MYIIILLLFFLIAFFVNFEVFENFNINKYLQFQDHTSYPFNNMRIGNTSNMSYDLRGDPLIIPHGEFIWNNSEIYPIYNTSIDNI